MVTIIFKDTSVVNNHSEPFWFFLLIMILASLPHSLLISWDIRVLWDFLKSAKKSCEVTDALHTYSLCWLTSVLIFFSISATKLQVLVASNSSGGNLNDNSFINLKNSNKNYLYLWILIF